MQTRNRLVLLVILVIIGGFVAFFLLRRDTQAQFGPAVALCPGPDAYGYVCAPGGTFAYIDATEDTELYQDDGVVSIDIPFPFTFYGTTYTTIQAGSNGTLQFGAEGTAEFLNSCLDEGPLPFMGDMLAPYWDDLNLVSEGYLETAVVGEAPNRIFVIEWDGVPRFGGESTDTVTFAVQLFEENNDILFLYQDVTTFEARRGGSATIGIQSAAQGLALQYSCNQPAVADTTGIYFPHPERPNGDLGLETILPPGNTPELALKGPPAQVLDRLTQRQPDGLSRLEAAWRIQQPPLLSSRYGVDVTGNGREELLLLWRGATADPRQTELALFDVPEDGSPPQLLLHRRLSTRQVAVSGLAFIDAADLTGDDVADILLHDQRNGRLFVITAEMSRPALLAVPGTCVGRAGVVDVERNGTYAIVREGCAQEGRVIARWNGRSFMTDPR